MGMSNHTGSIKRKSGLGDSSLTFPSQKKKEKEGSGISRNIPNPHTMK